jgi:hypothetical protein
VSEKFNYLKRLDGQRPEVERIRDAARMRGDLATMRNTEMLLAQWSALAASYSPANDGCA